MLQRVHFEGHAALERLSTGFTGKRHVLCVSDHVLSDMGHGVEFLLTNLTGKFLLCKSMDNLDMLMEGPQLLKGLITGHTLNILLAVRLLVQSQFALQHELLPALVADLHAPVRHVHVLLQVPAGVEHAWAFFTCQRLFLLPLSPGSSPSGHGS